MKLNIQYLQQALREGNPNARELAVKVSASLIEQIENLSYIASEFSNFAKMPEAKPEVINLVALLDKSLELYKNDTRVNVDMKAQEQELKVFADRSQLMRVFTNLLENAKQAIPENKIGNIQVFVTLQDSNGLVSISDNGTGIAADVAERIFQPYFTTKSSGTGLGLAMTRKIIEFWNGRIWFETEEGKGTTFFIQLPLMKG
jgi:signal transduction histidine kinase